ncbi:hypothetical protein QF035_010685 [Streptomyces umbrinus]|uniref:Uncharacterized protein n=2 Tax=Streptomyces umbrinus TaxID=67370 RepID=A0ABU0TBB6_9ACTN|nr:hypothetical protein [Streptomyces umbrinus]
MDPQNPLAVLGMRLLIIGTAGPQAGDPAPGSRSADVLTRVQPTRAQAYVCKFLHRARTQLVIVA